MLELFRSHNLMTKMDVRERERERDRFRRNVLKIAKYAPLSSTLLVYAPFPPLAQSAEGNALRNQGSFSLNCAVDGRPFCSSE